MLTDFACAANQYTSVGIHVAWPDSEVEYIIKNAQISCIVCSKEFLGKFIEISKNCPTVSSIVVMDDVSLEQ
jgi:long-subunit acyl-CoA synthetase (AMP-forming)